MQAEYQLGLKTDAAATWTCSGSSSTRTTPLSILGVGTLDTLADRPGSAVRDDLLAFYEYYSANRDGAGGARAREPG